jgi:beta-lactamase regulating signal transducer with metallopeptidase domain/predicted  nucleic acid-binding Zn-ribbon protein
MSAMLPSFVSILGWALVHFLWQGLLVGMATAIALMLLRNARPQARYAVGCIALALCMALPLVGVWRGLHAAASIGDVSMTGALASNAAITATVVDPVFMATSAPWQSTLQGQLPWIVALWSIGAGLLALRMAMGMMWIGRAGRARSGANDLQWQARLDRMALAFGIHRDIRLHVVIDLDSPVAARWWRPMVLVPAAIIARMPADLLEALLAHELAHIKRHDYLVNLVQSAIEALLFYHPVVWWLSKQIRIEREQIADDLAAQALGEPRRLALALQQLDLIQHEHARKTRLQHGHAIHPNTHLAPAAHGGNLMSRIQRLIRPNQHALSWRMALPIIGLAAVCLTVYAHDSTPALAKAASTTSTPAIATARAASVAPALAGPTTSVSMAPVIATADTRGKTNVSIRNAHTSYRSGDAYAIVRAGKDGISMSGDSRDIPVIEHTRQNVHGDFVWVRRGDKTYVVQDPSLIAKAVELWQPAEALGAKMEAMSAKMEIPSKQMEELGRQMEALGSKGSPYRDAMEKVSEKMQALGRQQEAIGTKMEALGNRIEHARQADRKALEGQMQALQAQMEPLDAQMEKLGAEMELHSKEMDRTRQPMEDLSKQMEEASKPMEALGKQMEDLGKQEEQLSHEADRAVKALIDEALRSGKGVPAESAEPN